jgi:hypothetical protein
MIRFFLATTLPAGRIDAADVIVIDAAPAQPR